MTSVYLLLCALVALWLRANLKKRSQFANVQNNVKSVITMVYGNLTIGRSEKTKPIQSQFKECPERSRMGQLYSFSVQCSAFCEKCRDRIASSVSNVLGRNYAEIAADRWGT